MSKLLFPSIGKRNYWNTSYNVKIMEIIACSADVAIFEVRDELQSNVTLLFKRKA